MTAVPMLKQLRAQGFDRSYYNPGTRTYHPRCSQCEALVINGTPCHETRCPNTPRDREESE